MSDHQRPSSRNDFDIALVCALPREYDAVLLTLDEPWDKDGDTYGRAQGDRNEYATGRIGKFNVVVCLIGVGKRNSTGAAASLRSSWPNVTLTLLVGICAGVNSVGEQQMRIGDVIISTAVVQHDFGRQLDDGFIRKDTPDSEIGPVPKHIYNLLYKLGTEEGKKRLNSKTCSVLDQLQRKASPEDKYKGPQQAQQAATAEVQSPTIHFGVVASGDQVIRSQRHRDDIVEETGAISLEMEGAGTSHELPCLVVKAVCDFGDRNKNKDWQDYASATAAAVSRAILESYTRTDKPSDAAPQLPTATQDGDTYSEKVDGQQGVIQGTRMTVASTQPPRNYHQKGSKFEAEVKAKGDIRQGNEMSFT
ncbi:hypothetical protein NCS52_00795000 [Fusarium sp. LHS14.1]|nr:hypothetical protein NCS52_00795000 [Fusarium sp. LHS14.1]